VLLNFSELSQLLSISIVVPSLSHSIPRYHLRFKTFTRVSMIGLFMRYDKYRCDDAYCYRSVNYQILVLFIYIDPSILPSSRNRSSHRSVIFWDLQSTVPLAADIKFISCQLRYSNRHLCIFPRVNSILSTVIYVVCRCHNL